jgi:hypothetical protein
MAMGSKNKKKSGEDSRAARLSIMAAMLISGVPAATMVAAAPPSAAQDNGAMPAGGGLGGFSLPPSPTPRPTTPERQGPEIDVRLPAGPPPQAIAPPAVAPTVPAFAPATSAPDQAATPAAPRTGPARQSPRPVIPPSASAEKRNDSAPSPPEQAPPARPAPALPAPLAAPQLDDAGTSATNSLAEPSARPRSPPAQHLLWLLWLTAGAFAAAIAWMMLRPAPARHESDEADDEPASAALPHHGTGREDAAPQAPRHGAARPPAPLIAAPATLAIAFSPSRARSSLIGWTFPYRLRLRNPGDSAMTGMTLRLLMTNVDDGYRARIADFLSGHDGMAAHAVRTVAAGATVEIMGELRVAHRDVIPVQVGGRALLIPLVAIHAQSDAGEGTAACFLLGLENAQTPGARMAPFRLDRGPGQYPAVGSRPVPLPTPLPASPLFRQPQPA